MRCVVKVLSVGMTVCDVLISPVPDNVMELDSITIRKPVMACGGDALNFAIALSKLGTEISLSGRVADDAAGAFIRAQCRKAGVHTDGLRNDEECATATTYALIDPRGERHFMTDKAIFSKVTDEDVTDEMLAEADIVYFGSIMALPYMNDGGLERLFRRAKKLGKLTAMDAAIDETIQTDDWLSKLSGALQYTDIFFPSFYEATRLTKKEVPHEIAQCFREFGMKAFGIKLGGKGCYVTDFEREEMIPPLDGIHVADTTGAGDSFMAGLICALGRGWNIFDAAGFASVVAAKNIEAIGGTAGVPCFEEAFELFQSRK